MGRGWGDIGVDADTHRLAITLLHVSVAFAIWRRGPLERLGSPQAWLSAVPALVVAGTAFHLAAPLATWPRVARDPLRRRGGARDMDFYEHGR